MSETEERGEPQEAPPTARDWRIAAVQRLPTITLAAAGVYGGLATGELITRPHGWLVLALLNLGFAIACIVLAVIDREYYVPWLIRSIEEYREIRDTCAARRGHTPLHIRIL